MNRLTTPPKAKRYDSRFDLVQRTPQGNRTVCVDLTYAQAAALHEEMPAFIVKFARMEVVA
jgi:hypothetical protein